MNEDDDVYREIYPQEEVDEYELDIDGYEEDEDEAFEIAVRPRASRRSKGSSVAKHSNSRKRRRGEIFHCKHGCGYTYTRKSGEKSDRSARDAYDYHETQGCRLLPRLLCPLGCKRKGKLVSFGGIKALRNHYKSKGHVQEMANQGVEKMEKLSAVDGPPASVPQLPPIGLDNDSSDSSDSSESSDTSSTSLSSSEESTKRKRESGDATTKVLPKKIKPEVESLFEHMYAALLEDGAATDATKAVAIPAASAAVAASVPVIVEAASAPVAGVATDAAAPAPVASLAAAPVPTDGPRPIYGPQD